MITRHARGKTVWVDLECPTQEEITDIAKEFDIDERVNAEVFTPTQFPLAVSFPGYAYLILHFPVAGSEDGTRSQEVDFIVGKHFLITVRYEPIEPIHHLHRMLEAEELLGTTNKDANAGALLEHVLGQLYGVVSDDVEQVGRKLERIERDIFSGKERQTVRTISETNRILLRFHTAIARHKEPLADFLAILASPGFFGVHFDASSTHIESKRVHAASLIDSLRAVAHELRVTNDSLLTSSQNEVMKILTIMAFVTFPLSLIAAVFGMNTVYLPFVGQTGDFWIVIGIMVALTTTFFVFFRFKKWL